MTTMRRGLTADIHEQRRVREAMRMLDHGPRDRDAVKYVIVFALGMALLVLSVIDLVVVLGVLV